MCPIIRGILIIGCVEIKPINHIVLELWSTIFCEKEGALEEEESATASQAPVKVTTRVEIFKKNGITGSKTVGRNNQLMTAPPDTAPNVSRIIGKVMYLSLSITAWVGALFCGPHSERKANRKE